VLLADFTNLQAALWYAKRGWAVFPAHTIKDGACTCGNPACGSPGKHPIGQVVPNGVKQASRFEGSVRAWWNKYPSANIGIACGKASLGLVVLDIDAGHGGDESLAELEADHGKLPDTPTVITGGGGRHFYFHSDAEVANSAGKLGEGIDLRGEGGYVIAPRSAHISGRTYEWEASSRPETVQLAELPSWMCGAPKRGQGNGTTLDRVDPTAVFAGIPAGKRHAELYRYVCHLRSQAVVAQPEAITLACAAFAACQPAYTDEEPEAMVADVWQRYPAGPNSGQGEPTGPLAEAMDEEPTAPIITCEDRSVCVEWVSRGIRATAKTLKEHSDGRIGGHLTIETTLPGMARALRSAQFTFTALRSRTELANDLKKKLPELNWDGMIEDLCEEVTRFIQQGEETEEIDTLVEAPPAEYAIWPLVLYKHPTILFGDPEATKSYISALLIYLIGLPPQRILEMEVRKTLRNPIYLDWEGERDALASRLYALRVGMELPPAHIAYRKGKRSLMDDVDAIKAEIRERESEFVIIDSLGPACGLGNLNDSQPPMEFFTALRSLGVSSLILAHNAKNAPSSGRTVYGNMFFGALARSIWEARRDDSDDADSVEVGLFHKKMNYGRRERPIGLRFHFGEGATLVTPHSVKELAAATGMMPLTDRILRALKESGKMSVAELAEQMGAGQETVRVTLYKLRDRHPALVERFDKGRWAAVTQEESKEAVGWARF